MSSQDITAQDPTSDDSDTPVEPVAISGGEVLINLESMIKTHLGQIDKMQDEAKKLKDMLDDIFANEPLFQEHDKIAREAAKVRSATKAQILLKPQAAELNNKVKAMKSEVKQLQSDMSDYLQEYQRMSGVNEIEDDAGEVREIVYQAHLIKKAFRPH